MPDPIHLPLSPYHQAQLAELRRLVAQCQHDEQTIVKTIIGAQHAPGDMVWTWPCTVTNDALVLTPPADG